MNKLDRLISQRAEERRRTAWSCVSRILRDAKNCSVDISVVGSLAKNRFRVHSDIDLLVHGKTDPAQRSKIEQLVAAHLRNTGIPYDVIYASDIAPERAQELMRDCV